MTLTELKSKLEKLIGSYFSETNGATVVWGMTKLVSSHAPQIVLTMLDIVRTHRSITQNVNGVQASYYPSKTTLQVDLFTKGTPRTQESGVKAAYVNTATDDLVDFVNFINSVYVDHWCGINDISILANQFYDLTNLINDTTWEYRAMVELDIGFTQVAVGHRGIMWEDGIAYGRNGRPLPEQPEFAPTSSGGRTQEFADDFTGWFEAVEGPELEEKEKI